MLATAIKNNSIYCGLSFEKMNLFFIRDVKLIQEEYKIRSKFYKAQVKHEKIHFRLSCGINADYIRLFLG